MSQDLSRLSIDRAAKAGGAPRRRRGLWLALGLLALAAAAYGLLAPRTATVRLASVVLLFPSRSFTLLNANGYVVADRKAAVASKTSGRLVWLGVEEGSRVEAGQVLARLESDDLAAALDRARAEAAASRASLDQSRAELEDAQREFLRLEALERGGAVARAEFDAVDTRRRKAQAGLRAAGQTLAARQAAAREAEAGLEYAVIRAPFAGVVLTKNADLGDMVTPLGAAAGAKASVVSLADLSTLQVEADVAEANLAVVRSGQPCEITLDSLPGERFPGAVHMIVPTADRSKASVMVKVRFAALDPRVLPEMSAKVAFLSRPVAGDERQPVLAVHQDALLRRDGRVLALVYEAGKVRQREVAVARSLGDMLEVTSGLQAEDKVVLSPPPGLKDGDSAVPGEN